MAAEQAFDLAAIMCEPPSLRGAEDARPGPVSYAPHRAPAWSCVCSGEERAGAWRHSPSCPVRGPGWAVPPRFDPYPVLVTGRPRRLVRGGSRALWMDTGDDPRPAPRERRSGDIGQQARVLYETGLTWQEVGDRLGVTNQTARDWGRAAGAVSRRQVPPLLRARMAAETGETGETAGAHGGTGQGQPPRARVSQGR